MRELVGERESEAVRMESSQLMSSLSLQGVVLCTTIVFIGGILSSFAPGYGWIIVCLSLMGFGMGGFPQW